MKKIRSNRRLLQVAALVALVAAWVSLPMLTGSVKADGTPVIIVRSASLASPTGSINPHGASVWQLYQSGNREFEVEVEDLTLPTGTVLTAFVNGASIGTLTVDSQQKARLKLRTEDGQVVPTTNDGSTVDVKNGAAVIVAGVFGGGGPNPTPTVTPTGTPTGTPSPSPSPNSTPNAGDLFAGLSGATINGVLPGGFAQYELHGSRTELEVRVHQINLPAGTTLNVLVNGTAVGDLILESGGEGRLRLRSDNGQTVPAVIVGSTITIRNAGAAILTGTFTGFTGPSPSPTPTGTPGPTPSPSPSPSLGRSFESNLTNAGTAARGEFKVTLNANETQATAFGEFHSLSSSQTGARIETAVGTTLNIFSFPVIGGTNGNFATVTFPVNSVQVQMLRAGLWSAMITSINNPAGEISGAFRQQSNISDFDGDGSNDLAVFRPSSNTWYSQNSAGFNAQVFGSASDKIVSGDYDGDGKTDVAVYRDVNGQGVWEIKRSSDGGITGLAFGLAADTPVRGDFDGDGRLDLAVYRPSNGVWYIQKSNNTGYSFISWGLAEDKPMPADIDGDGKDDVVVYRPSVGNWYWIRSSDGQTGAMHFGATGDIPVRGDFDGDGRSDVTVFRPSTGIWYTFRSSDQGTTIGRFGLEGDIPVAGDYDADGKADIAVFRPSDGNWYFMRSSDGQFQAIHFGLNGDKPIIAQ